MPLVRNVGVVPHRYYLYGRRQYVTWAPGEAREVTEQIADQVCRAHPEKMVLDALVQEKPAAPETPSEALDEARDIAGESVDRIQRGGGVR